MQEVWITLRLKGEMSTSENADKAAEDLLRILEDVLAGNSIFGFEVTQPGDVIEVEEEAEIYDNG